VLCVNNHTRRAAYVLKKHFGYDDETMIDYVVRTGCKKGVWRKYDEIANNLSEETFIARNTCWILVDLLRQLGRKEHKEDTEMIKYEGEMPEWFDVENTANGENVEDGLINRIDERRRFEKVLKVFGNRDFMEAAADKQGDVKRAVAKKYGLTEEALRQKLHRLTEKARKILYNENE